MTRDITVSGYDPFASPYDAPQRDVIGSIWGGIKSIGEGAVNLATAPVRAVGKVATGDLKGAWNVAKNSMRTGASVVTGQIGKYALAGAALAFPPAAPALGGIYAAGKVLQELDSKDPAKRAGAATTIAATMRMSKAGDPAAQRGAAALQAAQGMMRKGIGPAQIRRAVDTSHAPTRFSTSYSGTKTAHAPTRFSTSHASAQGRPLIRGTLVDERGNLHGPATWEMR
jgi:hypothetical protein